MERQALLVDYRWCSGCHSCELACQVEHNLDSCVFGIKINEIGPWEYGEGKWQLSYFPVLTKACNLCAERQAHGKLPSCVQHCQANCIQLKDASEAARIASENPHTLFMTL